MPFAACHVVTGAGHQLARFVRAAARTGRNRVPGHEFLEFFFTGLALVFIDRHFSLLETTGNPPGRSAFRHGVAVQAGQDGHHIFEQEILHKRADKVSGSDVDFLDQGRRRVRNMQRDVA